MSGINGAVIVVRLRHGVVGETRRVCHVVPIPDTPPDSDELVTLCGEHLPSGDSDVLDGIKGMPCAACLRVTALRTPDQLEAAS